jgi:hypothetical protein
MASAQISDLSVRQLLARRQRLAGGLSAPERTLRGVLLSEGSAVFERGVSLPPRGAPRPVPVSGGVDASETRQPDCGRVPTPVRSNRPGPE